MRLSCSVMGAGMQAILKVVSETWTVSSSCKNCSRCVHAIKSSESALMTPPLRVLGVRVSGTRRAESGRVNSDKMALDIGLGSHGGSGSAMTGARGSRVALTRGTACPSLSLSLVSGNQGGG